MDKSGKSSQRAALNKPKQGAMIPVVLPSGREILLGGGQYDSLDSGASTQISDFEDVAIGHKGREVKFEDLVETMTEIGTMLRAGMERIRPQKATVELSIGIDAKTGRITAFFVDGQANGSITVTLEWGEAPGKTS